MIKDRGGNKGSQRQLKIVNIDDEIELFTVFKEIRGERQIAIDLWLPKQKDSHICLFLVRFSVILR